MEFLIRRSGSLRRWLLCFTACMGFAALGEDDMDIRLKTTVPILTASPNVCELPSDQRACSVTIALVWEVPRAGNFCLYHQPNKQRLQCWANQWSGVYQFEFKSGASEKILLIRDESDVIVAQTEVRVIGAIEQQVRARRRSGIWRIF